MKRKRSVVVVGGGTGTHTVLKGLRRYTDTIDLTAIVSMADSGGSTGRLRDEFGQLPVGDVRMALTALAAEVDEHDELLRELFLYRFEKGVGLSGHNVGNLLLTALTDILGSEEAAVQTASRILRVNGTVLPVTTDNVQLQAEYDDGVVVVGEHAIDDPPPQRHASRIRRLSVTPRAVLSQAAAHALNTADLIVLGPGDLYSSVLANCVVDGFAEKLFTNQTKVLYISNLMSRPGQTVGLHAKEHVAEVAQYIGALPHTVLVHAGTFTPAVLSVYQREGNHPVENNCSGLACDVYSVDIASPTVHQTAPSDVVARSLIRHDPDKLASAIMEQL